MNPATPPSWRLPSGVSPGVWEYAHNSALAAEYDAVLRDHPLQAAEAAVLPQALAGAKRVLDLGCGTGRWAVPLALQGYDVIGVDLSPDLLSQLNQKAATAGVSVPCVQANLVELDCLVDESCDAAICLFSTLGMVNGRKNRLCMLRHVARILRPGGRLLVHAHNRWQNLWHSPGRRWLLANLAQTLRGRAEWGDRIFSDRGVQQLFLHIYSRRELHQELRRAGFQIVECIPLNGRQAQALSHRWFAPSLRAGGWFVLAQRPG